MLKYKYLYIIALSFIFILVINGCKKEENIITPPSEHFEPEGWLLKDTAGTPQLYIFQGVIKTDYKGTIVKDTITLNTGVTKKFEVFFVDANQALLEADDDGDHTLGYEVGTASLFEFEKDTSSEWKFKIKGKIAGSTTLKLMVMHNGHSDVLTPLIPVKIK